MQLKSFLFFLVFALLTITAHAKSRTNTWEGTLMAKHQGVDTTHGKYNGIAEFDDNTGWGFTLGYNFDDHINLAWEFSYTNPTYTVSYEDERGRPQTERTRSDFYTNNLNLTYHLLRGNITPFIEGGIGFTYVDSNISDGDGYCYSTPYDYYCYLTSYDTTEWSYNAALGLRADLSNTVFIRGSYGYQKVDLGSGSNKFDSVISRFEAGLRF